MNDLKTVITEKVVDFIKNKGFEAENASVEALFETPADSKLGDLALPCFKLSKIFRDRPDNIAKSLSEVFEGIGGIEKADAVGGYLNFFFDKKKYLSDTEKLREASFDAFKEEGKGKTICIDFSSPNIAKRFHLGHIGTTIIGNSLRNIYKFLGYNVVAINHLGDWGTSFGKLICAFKMWSSKEIVEREGVAELERIYAKFNKEAQTNEKLNQDARDAFAALERGNEEYLEIWRYFRELSLREYMKTYELLGIDFDSYTGESFFTDKMPAVVKELREKNLLKIDDGASVIDLSEYNMPPCLILKRDGSTLYPTRDIAAAKWRKQEYDFYKCLYVTSAGQSLHFAQWFKTVELMGYDWAKGLVHVPYGTMSFGGEKLASRTGNIIYLDDLLAQSIEKCEKIIEEKNNALADKKAVARAVGVGAIVFNALANSRIKDTDFNWEDALSFEGSTGPYLQYTYARAASVLRRGGERSTLVDYEPCDDEAALVRKLSEFASTVNRAADEYEPSFISRFALSVCAAFNQFYHNCRILGSGGDTEKYRLALTEATRNILGKCLDLLGMQRTEEI